VVTTFHLFNKDNKLKLLEVRHLDEAGRTNGPNLLSIPQDGPPFYE